MRYTVKLTTSNGEVQTRDFEAASESELRNQLQREGSFPLDIKRVDSILSRRPTLKTETLILFNQELLALLKAGIPLLQALELLVGHGKDPLLRSSLEKTVEFVKGGLGFSEALEQVGTFPAVYRSNIVAGERSGTMPEVIARWLDFQKFATESRRRIVNALIYPAFLVVVMGAAMAVIFNVVLPRFSEFYAGSDTEMPGITKVLLGFSKFMQETLYFQIGILAAAIVAGRWFAKSERGRRVYERILLGIPKIGHLYLMYHSSIFSRTLATLLAGGLPAVQALETLQRTTPSERMKSKLHMVIEQVRAGTSLTASLDNAKILDPLAVEMIRVGEQSSALPEMLTHVADFFDGEVERSTTVVTTLIGPALILFMGITVLAMMLAVYMPLFNASSAVK